MTLNGKTRFLAAATLMAFASTAMLTSARADIADYEFQLVDAAPRTGEAILSVRLVNKKTGKTVPDAVIIAMRIDMAPDGMGTMTSSVEPMPSLEPGIYRFKADLMMAGGWRLSLGAKVQGETGTVESKLVFKAGK